MSIRPGSRVRVHTPPPFEGCKMPYHGMVGEVVQVHDQSVRLRHYDVRLDGRPSYFCFAPVELVLEN